MAKKYEKDDSCFYDCSMFCEAPIVKRELGLCVTHCQESNNTWQFQKMSKGDATKFLKNEKKESDEK